MTTTRVSVLALLVGLAGCVRPGAPAPGLESVADSEGLAIDADGTVYFSQPSAVGRLTTAGKLDKEWAKLPGATKTWGIAIDRPQKALYIGSPATATVYKVTLDETPTVTTFVPNAGAPNGLTMGPDGALYYTDFQPAGDIYRVTADGNRAKVTAATLPRPNGLAFSPDGALYVDLFERGAVTRLTLARGVEIRRAPTSSPRASTRPTASRSTTRATSTSAGGEGVPPRASSRHGKSIKRLAKGKTANVEFGAGAVPATDLYAVTEKKLVRISNDLPGAPVPWHTR